jgi:hypothetical protein
VADVGTQWGALTAGSYLDTDAADGLYEELTEEVTGGKPAKRRSRLSHTWSFDVAPGPRHRFYVKAHHSPNSEGDDFVFEYSRDGVAYVPMVRVSASAATAALASYAFPEEVSGTLYVRVSDADRSAGNYAADTLYVDEMFVVTSWLDGDTAPPAAPGGLVATAGNGSVALDWADNAEADLAGYHVYRANLAGGPYAPVTAAPLAASAYNDSGVVNGTTYYYVVTAVDTSANESAESAEASATPQAGGSATTMHVAAVVMGTANGSRGAKHGRAEVTVVDDLGNPVAGALVTGSFSGDLTETNLVETTDANGVAVFTTTGSAKKLSVTFCVDDVTGAGLGYDAGANTQTCQRLGAGV